MALSYSTLRKPANSQIIDPSTGRMREEWQLYFQQLTTRLNAAVGELSGSAGDVVGPASATDGNLASFDTTTGKLLQDSGIASADVLVDADIGSDVQAYAANLDDWSGEAVADYSDTAAIAAAYQPLDAELTALAGLSGSGVVAKTGAGTFAERTITASDGISVTDGDGVSGNPTIAISLQAATFYDTTGGQTLASASATTVNIDTTLRNNATGIFSLASDVVTVAESGDYMLSYVVTGELAAGTRSGLAAWLEIGTTEIPGTRSYCYGRLTTETSGSCQGTVVVALSASNTIRLQAQGTSQDFDSVASASSLTLMRIA
jgi:hypothetical protein